MANVLVTRRAITVVVLWHTRALLLALWHSGLGPFWPCVPQGQCLRTDSGAARPEPVGLKLLACQERPDSFGRSSCPYLLKRGVSAGDLHVGAGVSRAYDSLAMET